MLEFALVVVVFGLLFMAGELDCWEAGLTRWLVVVLLAWLEISDFLGW